ncbi:hypothetical protein [Poseidonibacter ostreae]|uniref:Uncharacterized protein n=1 Tax=Poseidonibacter ostreae TaxID=2654171 RepID=A0A6L4WZ68_9BACT|nr:hypothetical protein [Poseidonibacter ostreae]KAB7891294.1 hypothetical protein GBG19_00225 [Poseidonibacter ostreae]
MSNKEEAKAEYKDYSGNAGLVEKAIFSSQYKRKIFLKHWFFTKKGFILMSVMFLLNQFELLGTMTFSAFCAIGLYLYLKDETLLHSRENNVWLLVKLRLFIDSLENLRQKNLENRANDDDIKNIIKECTKDEFKKND